MFKKFFPKLQIRDVCILGLLMAVTALLSIFCTFRIGTLVKIPLKFISVFVTAFMYGPLWGGICGASGDILNCLLAPVGPFIPQITAIEFLSGFIFGLFFLGNDFSRPAYIIRIICCAVLQLVVDMFLSTALFTFCLGWFASFKVAFMARIPAGIIKFLLQVILLIVIHPTLLHLKQLKEAKK